MHEKTNSESIPPQGTLLERRYQSSSVSVPIMAMMMVISAN
jgi:hypothetical protein